MKKTIKTLIAVFLLGLALNSTSSPTPAPPPAPCECCTTNHVSKCLDCNGEERDGNYNCGLIDPIEPD